MTASIYNFGSREEIYLEYIEETIPLLKVYFFGGERDSCANVTAFLNQHILNVQNHDIWPPVLTPYEAYFAS